ncbi:hypothetical protein BOTBODRAFT_187166 [Botryobasidium botryosum FD-172 SS1]|uniref:C2H2-type domain-containing protein n=1 Tax=Botryobasidium botryosum (strain FD-172 SS1) TaxID=930990 RepID=A0A067MIY5_BOTB1|nr:hypothetical protein BOTBODRAFT_187166 [Botryobasidium botryosum FD-172 SS1]
MFLEEELAYAQSSPPLLKHLSSSKIPSPLFKSTRPLSLRIKEDLESHSFCFGRWSNVSVRIRRPRSSIMDSAPPNPPQRRRYQCDECPSFFGSTSHLNRHKKTLHRLHTEIFKCEFPGCVYKTYQKSNLRHHEIKHSNKCPFECNACGKGFKLKHALQRHEKSCRGNLRGAQPAASSRPTTVGTVILDPAGVSSSQYVHHTYLSESLLSPQLFGNNFYQTVVTSEGLSLFGPPTSILLDQPNQLPPLALPYLPLPITPEPLPTPTLLSTSPSVQGHDVGLLNLPPSSGGSRLVVVDDLEVAKFLSENVDLFDSARYLPPDSLW